MVSPLRLFINNRREEVDSADDFNSVGASDMGEARMASSIQHNNPAVDVGMNLLLGAHEHGTNQLAIFDAEMAKLRLRMEEVQRDRAFTQVMVDVANEYYGGFVRPSGQYTVGDLYSMVGPSE